MSAMASASPNAIWIVVEVVGASELGHASFTSGIRMQMSDDAATVLCGRAVMPSRGMAKRLQYWMIGPSSLDSPEWDSISTTSSGVIMPRRSEEHTSELQSLMRISYAVFCLKKKNKSTQKLECRT